MEDLEKRKEAYGICGECNEPDTGDRWCQPCNAKRFKENFKNWTSGNKDIDELIQLFSTEMSSKEKPRDLWKDVDYSEYQVNSQ